MFLDASLGDHERLRDGGVRLALGHQRQDAPLARTENCEGIGALAGADQLTYDFRVEDRASARDLLQCVDELSHVTDPFLEEVTDPLAAGGQQVTGVACLHALGEHHQAQSRVLVAQLKGRGQSLVGERGWHADVDDCDVRLVLADRRPQRGGVGDRGDHSMAAHGEQLNQAFTEHGGVVGHHEPKSAGRIFVRHGCHVVMRTLCGQWIAFGCGRCDMGDTLVGMVEVPVVKPVARPSGTSVGRAALTMVRTPITRRAGTEVLYACGGWALGVAGLACVIVFAALGVVLLPTAIGLPLLGASLLSARAFAGAQCRLATRLVGSTVQAPGRLPPASGALSRLQTVLGDGTGWRTIGYLSVRLPVATLAAGSALIGWIDGIQFVFYPLVRWLSDPHMHDAQGRVRQGDLMLGGFYFDTWPRSLLVSGFGLVVILGTPWVVRGLLAIDRILMGALLGPSTSSRRVQELERSRASVIDMSATQLRQIERDLHDGAQVQLVALTMNLAMAREHLTVRHPDTPGLGEVRSLVDVAHSRAQEAIRDLRNLVRGIHPSGLGEGLGTALTTLASRSPIPVEVQIRLQERPADSIETVAYFCVAELLANVAKHSMATRATIEVTRARRRRYLKVTVTDDGVGGARVRPGGGLAGLTERVGAVDGSLRVSSRHGGPTSAVIELPLRGRTSGGEG